MRVKALLAPELGEAARHIEEAIAQRSLVLILGLCSVEYEGRGASKIGDGERLVVIKPDGAVLVHRPTGYSPVNWQPDTKAFEVKVEQRGLLLRSVREKPREVLSVWFSRVDAIVVVREMIDKAEFVEYLDEHEIRDFLAQNPWYIEEGLRIVSVEKPVEPGFVDLYGVDSRGRRVVIEIKRVTAGKDAVLQLKKYIDALRKHNPGLEVRGIIVAPGITKPALQLLQSLGLEYKQISLQKIYSELKAVRRQASRPHSLLEYLGR